jgi:hypothetical protein
MSVPAARTPRSYVKRKRYLNESIELIKKTLECLASLRREPPNPADISAQATARALEIEATCWTTFNRPANDEYNRAMMAKTRQVCMALIETAIGTGPAAAHLQSLLAQMRPAPPPPRRMPFAPIAQSFPLATQPPDLPGNYEAFPTFTNEDIGRDPGIGPIAMYEPPGFFKFDI